MTAPWLWRGLGGGELTALTATGAHASLSNEYLKGGGSKRARRKRRGSRMRRRLLAKRRRSSHSKKSLTLVTPSKPPKT